MFVYDMKCHFLTRENLEKIEKFKKNKINL